MFDTMDANEKLHQIAEAVVLRERELWGYQLNADNYQIMLQSLPGDVWPPELAQHRGKTRDQIMPFITDEQVDEVADLVLADQLRCAVRAERFEIRKVNRVRMTLLERLPFERRHELIASAKKALAEREEHATRGMNITLQLPESALLLRAADTPHNIEDSRCNMAS